MTSFFIQLGYKTINYPNCPLYALDHVGTYRRRWPSLKFRLTVEDKPNKYYIVLHKPVHNLNYLLKQFVHVVSPLGTLIPLVLLNASDVKILAVK